MLKFDNSSIYTGQIKQILSSFNLPKYRVYTKEQQAYHDYAVKYNKDKSESQKIPEEKGVIATTTKAYAPEHMQYAYYIKDNRIQYYALDDKQWHDLSVISATDNTKHVQPVFYSYGQEIPNNTRKLKITNNIYDYYTHEYLGEYLRFKRDYLDIDLMPLYNCFNNRICNTLSYSWETASQTKVVFNASDTNYKIYMLPVHLFKKYTIAIDAPLGVEICCGIYGKYQDEREKFSNLPELTYKKYSKLVFSQPVVYDLLTTIDDLLNENQLPEIAQNEADLKLFIKLPTSSDSAIVVLEGNYLHYNDGKLSFVSTLWETKSTWTTTADFKVGTTEPDATTSGVAGDLYLYDKSNDSKTLYCYDTTLSDKWRKMNTIDATTVIKTTSLPEIQQDDFGKLLVVYVNSDKTGPATLYKANNVLRRFQNTCAINFNTNDTTEFGNNQDFSNFKPITALQLLRINTKTSYPFADRLIEYLSDNSITSEEELADNLKRVQKVMLLNTKRVEPKAQVWNNSTNKFETKPGLLLSTIVDDTSSIWSNAWRAALYEKFNQTLDANINDINHDILGYVDKDIEKHYRANYKTIDESKSKYDPTNIIFTTISSIDLYTDTNNLYSDEGENREDE